MLQDGTIGDDLVVKPISAQVRSHIDKSYPEYKSRPFSQKFLYENQDFVLEKRRTTENDDYEFLDEFESLDDDDVIRRQKRNSELEKDLVSNFHVVFKRKDNHLTHPSDYGKNLLQIFYFIFKQCPKNSLRPIPLFDREVSSKILIV